jgi:hypothetical protein
MKSTSDRTLTLVAIGVSVCIVVAEAYLSFAAEGHRWPYIMAIGVVCLGWIVRARAGDNETDSATPSRRRQITRAIVWVGAFFAVALATKLGSLMGWTSDLQSEIGERALGIIMGVYVVALANNIPKQIISARGLTMLRKGGWALVLGGLGYAGAWLVLPLRFADTAALLVMLAGVLTCVAALVGWCTARGPRPV